MQAKMKELEGLV